MSEASEVELTRGDAQVPATPTPGMDRREAFATDGMWVGSVRTDAGMVSGWHHHGDHESTIYLLRGAMRMESGPGGRSIVEAGPGDFLYVPKGAIHREGNPSDEPGEAIVVRAGTGETIVNVDGPAAG